MLADIVGKLIVLGVVLAFLFLAPAPPLAIGMGQEPPTRDKTSQTFLSHDLHLNAA